MSYYAVVKASGQSHRLGSIRAAITSVDVDQGLGAGRWSTLVTGSPVLEGAIAAFDCKVVERLERGTHSVIFCEVQAVRSSPGAEPLIYVDRGYRGANTP